MLLYTFFNINNVNVENKRKSAREGGNALQRVKFKLKFYIILRIVLPQE